MPATPPKYVVRPAKDLEEAKELWWPLMLDLGWVCPSYPSPLMYEEFASNSARRIEHKPMQRLISTSPNAARIG
jgi:hypothetical protein